MSLREKRTNHRIWATIKSAHHDFMFAYMDREEMEDDISDFVNTAIRKMEEEYERKFGERALKDFKLKGKQLREEQNDGN